LFTYKKLLGNVNKLVLQVSLSLQLKHLYQGTKMLVWLTFQQLWLL